MSLAFVILLVPSCYGAASDDDNALILDLLLLARPRPFQCTILPPPDFRRGSDQLSGERLDSNQSGTESDPGDVPEGPLKNAYFDFPDGPQRIWYHEKYGVAIFGGDMLLPVSRKTRASELNGDVQASVGRRSIRYRWPLQIPYVFKTGDQEVRNKDKVRAAMTHWEGHTPFRFVPRSDEANYIVFQAERGKCNSYVGMIGGPQAANVGRRCSLGSTIHEIGHALGLYHEHTRRDRDRHINIHRWNIKPGRFKQNFYISRRGYDLGPYDFDSIMHYGSYSFARDKTRPVLTRKDGSIIVANRKALTSCDVFGIRSMYGY